jgi:hypothetical protein
MKYQAKSLSGNGIINQHRFAEFNCLENYFRFSLNVKNYF